MTFGWSFFLKHFKKTTSTKTNFKPIFWYKAKCVFNLCHCMRVILHPFCLCAEQIYMNTSILRTTTKV